MTKARKAVFGLVALALFGGAYVHDLRSTDEPLEQHRRAHAAECAAWTELSPRVVLGTPRPGDARAALDDVLRRAVRVPRIARALVVSGDPLSPSDDKLLAAAQPHLAAVRAALLLDASSRSPAACQLGDSPPLMRALSLHTALALTAERALANGERDEGTAQMVDALAFAMELRSWGSPFASALSASLALDSTKQLARRWDDLSPPIRARLTALRWQPRADAIEGGRLAHTTALLAGDADEESDGDAGGALRWMPALVRDTWVLDELTSMRPGFDRLRVAFGDARPSTDRCEEALDQAGAQVQPVCALLDRIAAAEHAVAALKGRAAKSP